MGLRGTLEPIIIQMLWYMPKKLAHAYVYRLMHKKYINYKNPSTYDEIIHLYSATRYGKKYARFADKIQVRDFVAECGLEEILIPLASKNTYSTAEEIDFDKLPNEFVLKTNHASGPNHYYIVENKNEIDYKKVKDQFRDALKEDFSRKWFEYQYHYIEPRIYCEALLHDDTKRMTDYKIVCSYGHVIAILVCSDRDQGRDYYDGNWNYLEYVKEEKRAKTKAQRPTNLDEMIRYAEILSKEFPVARVDFYNVNRKVYFGEITLTPAFGYNSYLTEFGQTEIGRQINEVRLEVENK